MAGAESKEFLSNLTIQLDRLEKLKGLGDKTADTDETEDSGVAEDTEEEDDFAAKKKPAKKKAASFDDDEAEEEESEETEEEESEEEEPPKKTKSKKLTSEDCNDAAKAAASKHGRSFVLDLMKKKFKTQSVSELKPDQYEDFVTIMKKAEAK